MGRRDDVIHSDLQIFLLLVITLVIVGFLFVYSSSYVYAFESFHDPLFFTKKQFCGLGIGLIGLFFGRIIPINYSRSTAPLFFCISIILLATTISSPWTRIIHGSSRWIALFSFSFQPSEITKITLILYCAYLLEQRAQRKNDTRQHIIIFFCLVATLCLLLLKQPDFGLTITLLLTILLLFFIMNTHIRYIIIFLLGLLAGALYILFLRPYRLQRVITFLDPWRDPKGAGFQIIQSLIAIGSGHWCGIGIAHSKQKFFYLPMQHTDFIFSIIAEETGLIGSIFIISLYILLFYFGIRIALNLSNLFSTLTIMGFILLVSLQSLINMAVVTGLVPTKGIGLPFISYGNSCLVCYLFMIGVIINMVYTDTNYYKLT